MRLLLTTVLYLVSLSFVIAAAMDPAGTAVRLRRETVRVAAAVRTMSDSAGAPVMAATEIRMRPVAAQARPRELRAGEYRVAIGTVMSARLRTPIDSRTAQANDQIDAVLTAAVVQDGVELVPLGSALHGRIVQADAATKKAPLGRVELIFTVVQHAVTRSRAAINSRPLTMEADPPAETAAGRGQKKQQPIDLVLNAGHPIAVVLSEPLVVYVPTAR